MWLAFHLTKHCSVGRKCRPFRTGCQRSPRAAFSPVWFSHCGGTAVTTRTLLHGHFPIRKCFLFSPLSNWHFWIDSPGFVDTLCVLSDCNELTRPTAPRNGAPPEPLIFSRWHLRGLLPRPDLFFILLDLCSSTLLQGLSDLALYCQCWRCIFCYRTTHVFFFWFFFIF